MKREKPILFSAEMVRAILDGRKTQTRRIVKPRQLMELDAAIKMGECSNFIDGPKHEWDDRYLQGLCPHGAVGDELWVKEEHYQWGCWVTNGKTKAGKDAVRFQQHGDRFAMYPDSPPMINVAKSRMTPEKAWHKRNSLFMPRWASRIQLKITGVRVERLQDINVKDALEEGIEHNSMNYPPSEFAWLWNSINTELGKTWDDNPWVWVVEFERIKTGEVKP